VQQMKDLTQKKHCKGWHSVGSADVQSGIRWDGVRQSPGSPVVPGPRP
jgi:hypothetical protein